MSLSSAEVQSLTAAGIAALRRGDMPAARLSFGRVAEAGAADFTVHLGLAYVCQDLREFDAARKAVDAALALQPRDLRALAFKADHLKAAGDPSAPNYYQAVLQCAPQRAQLPPELQTLVARAQAEVDRHAKTLESALREQLLRVAAQTGEASPRYMQSLDLLAGRKQIYFQAPRLYYFPELPHIQFFERAAFPWLDAIEAATDDIRQEMLGVLHDPQSPQSFAPYVQRDPARPALREGGMLDNPDWSAFYLWKDGALVDENAVRCPRTVAALREAPLTQVPGRSPNVLFSQLRPGARIPAHNGFINTRLIVHLPLVVPPGCAFRVGNETREWVEGRAWLFDDTIEHEAWNHSDQTRVILLFEAWRPELSAAERAQVSALFQAIDQAKSRGAEWTM